MKTTDFVREMKAAGWTLLREGGNHSVYIKKGHRFPVPRHRETKEGLVKGWRKLNQQIDEEDGQ